MKRRILSVILCAAMLLSAFALTAAAETVDGEGAEAVEAAAADTAVTDASADAEEPAPEDAASDDDTAGQKPDLAPTADPVIPQITSVTPSVRGVTISWTAFEGAEKYYVFMQKPEGGWKVIGNTTATSFEHRNPDPAVTYIYTVRAANSSGAFVSGYDRTGYAFRCLSVPVLNAPVSVVGGQQISWQAVDGAVAYTVYVKYPTGWKAVARTTVASYLNTNVTSGLQYTYTVRCYDPAERVNRSYFDRKGSTGVYIAAPMIYGFKPANGGITVQWDAVDGAPVYAVFMKNNGRWKLLGKTDKTWFNHLNLNDNEEYVYTVRCMNKDGAFISGYNTAGDSFRYVAPPQITDAANNTVSWNAREAAAGYRVYRKEYGKSWVAIGNTDETSFADEAAPADTLLTYTVRCTDENGALLSYFITSDIYYYNGALADGTFEVGGRSIRFDKGVPMHQGYVTIDGRMYYYNANGVLQKNGLVGSSKEGWRYADENGVVQLNYTGLASNSAGTWYVTNGLLDRTLRTAVTIKGTKYNIINGKALEVKTEKDSTLFNALTIMTKVTKTTMSKSEKLRACWNHLTSAYGENNPRIPDYYGEGWVEMYANDIFEGGTGNCFSYGAAFAYLAKACGYSRCYACNSGGHGWAEVEGLVYDPEWSMHNSGYTYYGMSYDEPCDVAYASAISSGEWWMHVAV